MFRAGASKPAFRALGSIAAAHNAARVPFQFSSKLSTLSRSRPQVASKPLALAAARYATQQPPMDKINTKHEKEVGAEKLAAHPEIVSTTSSTHPVFGEVGTEESGEKDADMMAGVKQDLKTIKDTFSLEDVPREAITLGMAGVLPYLGTSLSTVYCAWEINHASATGSGMLMSGQTAEALLHVLEPLQVGYGAVILSFMGAIHWGMEWAGYGGYHGYKRYAIGVWAPAVAWPTIFFPVETALITQFVAFNFLYYTDSRASKRGWTPPWYAVYRFVLTFIVGASIVVSLIGRGQIADQVGRLPGPADRIRALRESQAQQAAEEETARRTKIVNKDEESEDEE